MLKFTWPYQLLWTALSSILGSATSRTLPKPWGLCSSTNTKSQMKAWSLHLEASSQGVFLSHSFPRREILSFPICRVCKIEYHSTNTVSPGRQLSHPFGFSGLDWPVELKSSKASSSWSFLISRTHCKQLTNIFSWWLLSFKCELIIASCLKTVSQKDNRVKYCWIKLFYFIFVMQSVCCPGLSKTHKLKQSTYFSLLNGCYNSIAIIPHSDNFTVWRQGFCLDYLYHNLVTMKIL